MTKTVKDIINDILDKEGGFVDTPKDNGHKYRKSKGDKWDSYCTNFGVTQYNLSEWLGRQATIEEVRNMDKATAFEIFELNFLIKPRINTLQELIQPIMADSSVNHGPSRPIKWMQEIINMAGFGPVDVDGVVGPKSRTACEKAVKAMGPFFVNALVERRIQFFDAIITRDPTQKVFEKGWKRRAESFRMETK